MKIRCSYVPYRNTGKFQPIVCDYLDQAPFLKPLYEAAPSLESMGDFMEKKRHHSIDRATLVTVLREQYSAAGLLDDATEQRIAQLLSDDTFTITTGQQTGILLGPMYSPMKILSAVKMTEQLTEAYPQQQFVPVFWMATEDHDVAEIDHVWVNGQQLKWNTTQSGPVGRFHNEGMQALLQEFKSIFGESPDAKKLSSIFEQAYALPTLSLATRFIVHALFGHMGLLIIDADDVRFKQAYSSIIAADIFEKNSQREVEKARTYLEQRYHSQVNGREINFFYLLDGYRERIVAQEENYQTNDGNYQWTEDELRQLIASHPERFSPNVLMRPLYEECILPNIAYIGGGAEVAYWLEMKGIFDHYHVPFPALVLRNSAMVIDAVNTHRFENAQLSAEDLFAERSSLEKRIVLSLSGEQLELKQQHHDLAELIHQLKSIAQQTDATLSTSAEAMGKRLEVQFERFSKKLIRAGKRRHSVEISRLNELWNHVYPGGSLQERKESVSTFMLRHSFEILPSLKNAIDPFGRDFLIVFQEA
ncbi:MAG: hypothetical protein RLZZ543_1951 [Bacteroidota bacterium]